jgi:hypothetical protein
MASLCTIFGTFINPDNSPEANGQLQLTLSQPAVVSGTGQVVPTTITVYLNAEGQIPSGIQVWGNDNLLPSGTIYFCKVIGGANFNNLGFLIEGATFNFNTAVPTATNVYLPTPPSTSGANTWSGTNTFNGSTRLEGGGDLEGTFTGSPTLSGNPTFSGDPVFSGTPEFPGSVEFSGSVTSPNVNGYYYVGAGAEYATLAAAVAAVVTAYNDGAGPSGYVIYVSPSHQETTASNPFQSLLGTNTSGEVICGSGVLFDTTAQWVIPDSWRLRGNTGSGYGARITAVSGFPSSTAIVQLGYSTDSINTRMEDFFVDAGNVSGSIGITCHGLQENCGMLRVVISDAVANGLYIDQYCQNSYFEQLYIGMSTSATSSSYGVIIDTAGYIRGINTATIYSNSGSTKMGGGIQILSGGGTYTNLHFEQCIDGIQINGPTGSPSVTVGIFAENITGLSNVTNLIHILNATSTRGVALMNIIANGSTNTITDSYHSVSLTDEEVMLYIITVNGAIQTSSPSVASSIPGGYLATQASNSYTPTATGLTVSSGSATITGHWSQVGNLVKFQILVTPPGGQTTSATLTTTNFSLPSTPARFDAALVVESSGAASIGIGLISTGSVVYVPSWTTVTSPVVISGTYEIA